MMSLRSSSRLNPPHVCIPNVHVPKCPMVSRAINIRPSFPSPMHRDRQPRSLVQRQIRLYSQKTQLPLKTPKDFAPGDFSFIKDEFERISASNAYNAVTRLNVWAFFDKNPPRGGYFRWDHPTLSKIGRELDSDGHTGMTMASTMRWMQRIRQDGWETAVSDYLSKRL